MWKTGETDFTAQIVADIDPRLLSPTALESLAQPGRKERAPDELLRLSDTDLLRTWACSRAAGSPGGALLAGTEDAIREHIPGHNWTFLQMRPIPNTAIGKIVSAPCRSPCNASKRCCGPTIPLPPMNKACSTTSIALGLKWPCVEALMNAFCHADLHLQARCWSSCMMIAWKSPITGGFIAGITPDNILHHQRRQKPIAGRCAGATALGHRTNLRWRMFAPY